MDQNTYFADLLARSRKAQKEFETFSQEEVDKAVRAIGKVVYDNAEELAQLAVDETGMGNYDAKILKNKGKPKATWWRLKGVKSRGIIGEIKEEGIIEVAKPIGVLGCVTPTTNPSMTPVHNGMIALKGGNSMIVGPHPRSKKTTYLTVEYMRQALKEVGAPEDLIICVEEPTIELSQKIMAECDACISTGGPGMVKAAYSSGKPAYGVGPGNIQALVDEGQDPAEFVPKSIASRIYDNGVLCTCEQSVIVPSSIYDETVKLFQEQGVYFVDNPVHIESLRTTIFPDGHMIDKDLVGAKPVDIAKKAGFDVPADSKALLVPIEKCGADDVLAKEKLCPVLSIYKYDGWKNAVDIALKNLLHEGAGHSVVLHSDNDENIAYAAETLPVSRFGVKMIGSSGLGGGFDNGLMPTATLGCGSWGNNSVAGNLWWNHLVNISKVAYRLTDRPIPTDEEIWAE